MPVDRYLVASWTLAVALVAACPAVVLAQGPSAAGQPRRAFPDTVGAEPVQPSLSVARPLSLDAAVQLALEQNLNLQVERLNPQIQDLDVARARSAWAPLLNTGFRTTTQNSPPNSALSGGQVRITDEVVGGDVGVGQRLPWGGSYSISWDSSRIGTNNIFTNFDPVLRSTVAASLVQPLARNFSIDASRQQLLVTRTNRDISEVQLRQTVVQTIRTVKNAYWDLVYAADLLAVQRQSLDLSREMLRNNRARVEIGTMAPIDVVEAEAEFARNEEAVILAEAAIEQAEDRLRALIFDPEMPDFWRLTIQPTDTPQLHAAAIDVSAATRNALEMRTDLADARKRLEAVDLDVRYLRNQTLPEINLQLNYSLTGLGGTQLIRGPGFPGDVITTNERSFGSVMGDIFGNDFPTWTVAVSVGYPIGTNPAEAALARARLRHSQSRIGIRSLELQVATQVRDVGRQVQTNLKRVEATRVARDLSERRLEAEQKRFDVGMSTSFQVFQAQRDLAQARNAELRALLDYNRSLVDFEAVQEAVLTGSGASLTVATTAGIAPAGAGDAADPEALRP